jgi:PAS domain S-box-containing protein
MNQFETFSCRRKDASAPEHTCEVPDFYRLLMRQSRDIILFLRRANGRILEASTAAERAYGYTRDELLEMTVFDLRKDDSLPLIPRQMADAADRGILFETLHRRKDGTVFPVEVSSQGAKLKGLDLLVSIVRDISTRKQAEKLLQESHSYNEFHLRQLDAVIHQLTEGLVIFDPKGNLLDMNPSALAIHGFDSVESLQRHLDTLSNVFELYDLGGEPLSTENWPIGRVLRGESFHSTEARVRRVDTGKTWVGSYGGTPVYDRDGNMLLAIVTLRDITDQKRMEDAFRLSEQQARRSAAEAEERRAQLQVLIENSPMEVSLTDAQGRIIYSNPAALKLHGFASLEEFQMNLDRLSESIKAHTPDGRRLPVSEWPMVRALAGETVRGMELHIHNRLTGRRWIGLVHATPVLDDSGIVSYVVIVSQDITDIRHAETRRRESETWLGLALDAGRMGTWDWDVNTNRVKWSDGFYILMGYQPGEVEPSYTAFRSRVHPEDVAYRNRIMREAMEQRREYTCEYRLFWSDGSVHWVEARGRFMYDAAGEPVRMYGVLSDIDQRKQSEQDFKQLHAELEDRVAQRTAEAEKRARQLQHLVLELSDTEDRERRHIAMVLHDDLQQYLAALHFALETLIPKERIDDELESRIDYLHTLIDNSIQRCRDLSHELSPPVLHQLGLLAALEWLAKDMEKKHGLEIRLDVDTGAEPDSPVLSAMLFRSIKELLFNAAKYSGSDTAVVQAHGENGHIRIRVRDEGKGCDIADLKSKRGAGPGFGLFSIEERIHFLGGRVKIDCTPGGGFEVTLHVPRYPAEQSAEPAEKSDSESRVEKPTEPDVEKEIPSTARIRVLLADDHAVMREGLANLIMGETDMEVVAQAENGKEALKLAGKLNPDIALMDITMPIMDGIEATARIHEAYPDIRIIGLSMHDDPATRERMIQAGAAGYVCKGDAAQELLGEVRRIYNPGKG